MDEDLCGAKKKEKSAILVNYSVTSEVGYEDFQEQPRNEAQLTCGHSASGAESGRSCPHTASWHRGMNYSHDQEGECGHLHMLHVTR